MITSIDIKVHIIELQEKLRKLETFYDQVFVEETQVSDKQVDFTIAQAALYMNLSIGRVANILSLKRLFPIPAITKHGAQRIARSECDRYLADRLPRGRKKAA